MWYQYVELEEIVVKVEDPGVRSLGLLQGGHGDETIELLYRTL